MKKGDIVVCIDNNLTINGSDIIIGLTMGKIYKIQNVEENRPTGLMGSKTDAHMVLIINDLDASGWYYYDRFKPLREHNLKNLNI